MRDPWELPCTGVKRRKMIFSSEYGLDLVVGDAEAVRILNVMDGSGAREWRGHRKVDEAVCRGR